MAAESLSTSGVRKHAAHYVEHPEKIFWAGHSYVGSVGWTVNQTVLQSALDNGLPLPEVRSERELFEFSRALHSKLKDEDFLNPGPDCGEPFESTQLTLFVMNRFGLFGLYSLRTVEQTRRFAAVGSGSDYALGAMHAAWNQGGEAEEIARLGVEAGIEFDCYSGGPIAIKKMKMED